MNDSKMSKKKGNDISSKNFDDLLAAIEDNPEDTQAPLEQITVGALGRTKAYRPLSNSDCKEIAMYHIPRADAPLAWHYLYLRACRQISHPVPPVVMAQFNKKYERKKKLLKQKKPSEPATMFQQDTIRSMGLMSRGNKPDLVAVSQTASRFGLLEVIKQGQAVQIHALTVLQYEAKTTKQKAAPKAKTAYELAVSALQGFAAVAPGEGKGEPEAPAAATKATDGQDGGYHSDSSSSTSSSSSSSSSNGAGSGDKVVKLTPEEMFASPLFADAVDAAIARRAMGQANAKRELPMVATGGGPSKRTKPTILKCEAPKGLSCQYMTCPLCRGYPTFDQARTCTFQEPCKYSTCMMCSSTKGK